MSDTIAPGGARAAAPAPDAVSTLAVTLRFALRNLRGGVRGFGVFLACIALGVASIAGVGSVARSLSDGLASQGRLILGGDVAASLLQREATPEELAFLRARGQVSSVATLRSMVRTADARTALVEPKAVDPAAYPAIGSLAVEPPLSNDQLFAPRDGVWGAAADQTLFSRLDLKPGDRVKIGEAEVELRAVLLSEPDKLVAGIGFGPRLLLSQDALRASGLLAPGSLVRWTYRLTLPPGEADDAGLARFIEAVRVGLPDSGFETRSRVNAAPQFQRNIERFAQFLTLVGLAALVVGGVGVANAVSAYVERRRASMATLKSLGATGGRVFAISLVEIMVLAALGTLIGLAVGAALPYVASATAGALLPTPIEPHVYLRELAQGALYGLLTALSFALWPLGRAHDVPVSALFRDQVDPDSHGPRWRYRIMVGLAVAALAGSAVWLSFDRRIALAAVIGTAGSFVLLRLVAVSLMALAARVPRPRRTELRMAVANIHRPGALTPSLVLSLGLGVTLLVTLALIDSTIRSQLERSIPARAPSFFFLDVPSGEAQRFDAFLAREAPDAKLERVPMMRGRVTALKGVPVAEVKAAENAAWVLEGDRGITFSATPPEGSTVVEGAWWPADYAGKPLVSFDAELAHGLGLGIGDAVTVNVLGRNITATVANLRRVEWQTLGINFVMVFSPNSFAGAPHTNLATLAFPGGQDAAREGRLAGAAGREFPNVTTVRVKDALDAINEVVAQLAVAIRGASSVALVAAVLVLGGALAAGHRSRVYDAVVLKTLGATRMRLLAAFLLEYGLLGLASAVFGALAGAGAAWWVLTRVMRLGFEWHFAGPLAIAVSAIAVTIVLGLVGTWRILGQKPAPYLRNL
ncbi:FtsX-like permease family protein [Alsobacter sp. SYSU M60028]|uniref:FtsX-like permease family protein n=1 Tax=Alsobacter ponti TaxID=2962936 RepID=A0ABT1LEG1_9HYPH|nr:FtsX-like permease family protein [Alsobacter ponti]MCP8939819.1 FtsX-like permease family protein [Alsobacter ponti]